MPLSILDFLVKYIDHSAFSMEDPLLPLAFVVPAIIHDAPSISALLSPFKGPLVQPLIDEHPADAMGLVVAVNLTKILALNAQDSILGLELLAKGLNGERIIKVDYALLEELHDREPSKLHPEEEHLWVGERDLAEGFQKLLVV